RARAPLLPARRDRAPPPPGLARGAQKGAPDALRPAHRLRDAPARKLGRGRRLRGVGEAARKRQPREADPRPRQPARPGEAGEAAVPLTARGGFSTPLSR